MTDTVNTAGNGGPQYLGPDPDTLRVRRREHQEADAWKVAQLAATLSIGPMSRGMAIKPSESVKEARRILAESRRAVSASTTEGASRG